MHAVTVAVCEKLHPGCHALYMSSPLTTAVSVLKQTTGLSLVDCLSLHLICVNLLIWESLNLLHVIKKSNVFVECLTLQEAVMIQC